MSHNFTPNTAKGRMFTHLLISNKSLICQILKAVGLSGEKLNLLNFFGFEIESDSDCKADKIKLHFFIDCCTMIYRVSQKNQKRAYMEVIEFMKDAIEFSVQIL